MHSNGRAVGTSLCLALAASICSAQVIAQTPAQLTPAQTVRPASAARTSAASAGDDVVVALPASASSTPFIPGSLWNGSSQPPTQASPPSRPVPQLRKRGVPKNSSDAHANKSTPAQPASDTSQNKQPNARKTQSDDQ